MDYARTMNKISFDHAIRRGGSGCAAPLVEVGEQFPQPPPKVSAPTATHVPAPHVPACTSFISARLLDV